MRVPGAPASYLRYAYHFDATLYAAFLRRYAEARGVRRIEGKVSEVLRAPESGDLTGVRLADGQTVSGEFFFDCTGFGRLLMNALGCRGWIGATGCLATPRSRWPASTTDRRDPLRAPPRGPPGGNGKSRHSIAPATDTSIAVSS